MWQTVLSDVLVIGGGMAAVRAAVEAAGTGANVALVDKGTFEASGSSPLSLTGLASTLGEGDSPELLFSDLVRDGYFLSDQNLAWEAAKGAEENVHQLEQFGFIFERKKDGTYVSYKGVGHSAPRGVLYDHVACQLNPVALLGKEAWRRRVRLCDRIMITRLLRRGKGLVGATGVSHQGQGYLFQAKAIVLAAGGANYLYPNSCSRINNRRFRTTGDALCLAFYAGAPLIDLEFPNFREGEGAPLSKLGARLLDSQGKPIMEKYAPDRLERAPRGKLVEAIYRENQEGRGPIRWQLPREVNEEYRTLYERYRSQYGLSFEALIDYQRLLGGAHINERAATPVPGLFAAGESAGGFNGADRMQGASFLETTFFGTQAGASAARYARERGEVKVDVRQAERELSRLNRCQGSLPPEEVIAEVRQTMWEKVGVIRNAASIKKALATLALIRREKVPEMSAKELFPALEAENLALTAEMVAHAALMREESRGTHLRADFPRQDDKKWLKHIAVSNQEGEIALDTLPVVTLPQGEFVRKEKK